MEMKKSNYLRKNKNRSWVIILFLTTILLSMTMSYVSSIIIQKINIFVAVILLLSIIFIGIIFDMIGIAVAAGDETPFHAMAASKIKGAKNAIRLVRNANKVTTFCNDVIGDVTSVISGTTSAFIVMKVSQLFLWIDIAVMGIIVSAVVAGLTVLGKGLGKTLAISKSHDIIYKVALLQYFTIDKLKIGFNRLRKIRLGKRVDRT